MNCQNNIFVGKLNKDPELKYGTESGKSYTVLSFPSEGLYNREKDEKETVWIDFLASGDLADRVCKYLKKGDVVVIKYILLPVKVELDGSTKKFYRTFVTDVDFVSWKSNGS
ncbi:MAG: single-stranded DNA-binding protein [Peptococcaceae bacterium]|nr:single-stranded DNA-binding protein [Peptococcaceae bacterium]